MLKSIIVVGDVILDRYIYGRVKRLNPESPTPLLTCEREEYKLGGAANVAANIASLGGQVTLAFGGGDDAGNREITRLLVEAGIARIGGVTGTRTIVKERHIELTYRQQLLRTDWDSSQSLSEDEMTDLV